MADEYEMIPHKLLSDLKFDVEALQKKLTQPDSKAEELLLELESMKNAVHELTEVFTKALGEIKDDGDLGQKLEETQKKLDSVISQNETIAKGMIAVSDKLEDFMRGGGRSSQQPLPQVSAPTGQHTMGPPPGPSRAAPMPSMDFPPPPPGAKKRAGVFP